MMTPTKFWANVRFPSSFSDCWIWVGYVKPDGYGLCRFYSQKHVSVHRVALEIYNGKRLRKPRIVHHICKTKACVNPDHLEVTTRSEHVDSASYINARKTHCPQQHPYSTENTHISTDGKRYCRICRRASYHRRKAARVTTVSQIQEER